MLCSYRSDDKYRQLKSRSRNDYDKRLTYFHDKLGKLEPRKIERPHVLSWRNSWAKQHTPHFANYRTRVLSIVLDHAKDMGLLSKSDENPVKA